MAGKIGFGVLLWTFMLSTLAWGRPVCPRVYRTATDLFLQSVGNRHSAKQNDRGPSAKNKSLPTSQQLILRFTACGQLARSFVVLGKTSRIKPKRTGSTCLL